MYNIWYGAHVKCVKDGNTVIKYYHKYKDKPFNNELKWIKILPDDISPKLISFDLGERVIVESYCGLTAAQITFPDNYLEQMEYCKKTMNEYNCNGLDYELFCDEFGILRIVDFSAFGVGIFDWNSFHKQSIINGTLQGKWDRKKVNYKELERLWHLGNKINDEKFSNR